MWSMHYQIIRESSYPYQQEMKFSDKRQINQYFTVLSLWWWQLYVMTPDILAGLNLKEHS